MSDSSVVRFEPVEDEETSEPMSAEDGSPTPATETEDQGQEPVRKAERDRYPLAGPILEEARSRVLRGRCSACEARLRVRLEPDESGSVRVRCPICRNTRSVDV